MNPKIPTSNQIRAVLIVSGGIVGIQAALANFVRGLLVPNWIILIAIAGVLLFFGMLL